MLPVYFSVDGDGSLSCVTCNVVCCSDSVTHQKEPCALSQNVNSLDTVLVSHQMCRFLLLLWLLLQDSQLSVKLSLAIDSNVFTNLHIFCVLRISRIVRVRVLKLDCPMQPISRLWKAAILSICWIASRHIAVIGHLALNRTASALENTKLVWKMPICIFNVFDSVLRLISYYLRAGKRNATCSSTLPLICISMKTVCQLIANSSHVTW